MRVRFRGIPLSLVLACAFSAYASVAAAQTSDPQLQDAPPPPRFTIRSIELEGNTILPKDEVNRLVAPYLGPDRDFGSVQQALEAIQDAYAERGYSAVRVLVPEQSLAAGRVRLQVIEARLGAVKVQGNQFFTEPNVVASLPALKAGEPPNTREIGRSVALANENPAKQTTVVLEGTNQPGIADAVVRVTDFDPKRITVSADNTGTPQTGMLRAGIGYQNANLTGSDDVLTLQYITSPTKIQDVKIFGAGYRLPVYGWGGFFDFIAGYSDVNSGSVQNLFAVSGSGTIFGARYTHLLPTIESYSQRVSVGVDYKAFKQNVTLTGFGGSFVPDITVHPVTVAYSGRFARAGDDLSFFASVSQNLAGGNDGDQQAFDLQRVGAKSDYRIFRAGAAWSKVLNHDIILRLAGNLQQASHPLIPGEQFGMGGQDSVRGFYEREAASDSGHRISAEVYGPDFGGGVGQGIRARVLGFMDAAQGRDKDPERLGHQGLSSFGVGMRITQGRSLSIRVDAAHVMNRTAGRPDNTGRVHFSVAYSF